MQPKGRGWQEPLRRRARLLFRAHGYSRELLRPRCPRGTLHVTHEAKGTKVAVADTPGALQEALPEWLAAADVVVKSMRMASRDIEPLMRMRKAVFKHSSAKIVYVVNGWNRFKTSRDFMEWFRGLVGDQTVLTPPARGIRSDGDR